MRISALRNLRLGALCLLALIVVSLLLGCSRNRPVTAARVEVGTPELTPPSALQPVAPVPTFTATPLATAVEATPRPQP